MSWGTCYTGSNNIHFDFPPMMSDGRNFSSWQPEAAVNTQIRQQENITSNWQYRQYLTNNATEIMKYNKGEACYTLGLNPYMGPSINPNLIVTKEVTNHVPILFQSPTDQRYTYQQSDLKNPYLSREQIQARMIAPSIMVSPSFQPQTQNQSTFSPRSSRS